VGDCSGARGGDDAMLDSPSCFEFDMLIAGEHCLQLVGMPVDVQVRPGAQQATDPVEWIPGPVEHGLLDGLAALIDLLAG